MGSLSVAASQVAVAAMRRGERCLLLVIITSAAARDSLTRERTSNAISGPNMDVGQFPFPRGETPIFNFDAGDEGFIATIPELIDGLDKIKDVMHKQRKITQAFGEAFDQCEACG